MRKLKSSIIQCNLVNVKNDTTGEVTEMTRILYTMDREDTEKVVGPATVECYKVGNFVKKIEKLTIKYAPRVELEIEEKPLKNGVKFVINSINGVVL